MTHRDFVEGESELVSGFNVYFRGAFALIFIDRSLSWFCAINGCRTSIHFNPRWLNFLILKLELRLKIADIGEIDHKRFSFNSDILSKHFTISKNKRIRNCIFFIIKDKRNSKIKKYILFVEKIICT